MDLSLYTYNVCSFTKKLDIVRELTNLGSDFIMQQETFITELGLGIWLLLMKITNVLEFRQRSLTMCGFRMLKGARVVWPACDVKMLYLWLIKWFLKKTS